MKKPLPIRVVQLEREVSRHPWTVSKWTVSMDSFEFLHFAAQRLKIRDEFKMQKFRCNFQIQVINPGTSMTYVQGCTSMNVYVCIHSF